MNRIKPKNFILRLFVGHNFDYGNDTQKYLAIDTMTDGWYEDRNKYKAVQFKTKKEATDWIKDNVSKNEQRFWVLYTVVGDLFTNKPKETS